MRTASSLVAALTALLLIPAGASADDWAPNLTAAAGWHSNATNAGDSDDQLDSLEMKADLLASQTFKAGASDTLRATAHLGAEWWPRYQELLRGAAGGRLEVRHRFGVDSLAPEIAVEGAADAVDARDRDRRGFSSAVTASARKRFDKLTRATVWYEVSWYNARHEVYDLGVSEAGVELDRDLSSVMRVTLTGRFRNGDIITYATGERPELEARAPHRIETDVFDRAMTAYRIDAQSWSGEISLARALDDSTAVRVGYGYRESRRGPLRFADHLLSVAMIHQF